VAGFHKYDYDLSGACENKKILDYLSDCQLLKEGSEPYSDIWEHNSVG
jgi:hypothetical protein